MFILNIYCFSFHYFLNKRCNINLHHNRYYSNSVIKHRCGVWIICKSCTILHRNWNIIRFQCLQVVLGPILREGKGMTVYPWMAFSICLTFLSVPPCNIFCISSSLNLWQNYVSLWYIVPILPQAFTSFPLLLFFLCIWTHPLILPLHPWLNI